MPRQALALFSVVFLTAAAAAGSNDAVVSGALSAAGETLPASVSLRFEAPPRGSGNVVTVDCPVERDGRWSCRVPAGELDLRLSAPGFAPHYAWGVRTDEAHPVSLGRVPLTRGASVSGWVGTAALDMKTVEVQLETLAFGPSEEGAGDAPPPIKTRPNARGFFQFTSVPVGTYVVTARAERMSPAFRSNVRVEELAEEVLSEALVLRPLARAEIVILPPLDPSGNRWKIELRRRLPVSSYLSEPVRGAMDDERWSADGLTAGDYVLRLSDRSGVIEERHEIVVEPEMPPVMIQVALVPVKGRVRTGTRGLHAKIELTSLKGGRAMIETDQEGRFEGYLPYEGSWRPKLTLAGSGQELRPKAVEVRRRDGDPHARVDFDLPGGVLRGTVSDDQGPASGARVIVIYPGLVRSSTVADEDGEFEIVAIAEGSASVEAHRNGLETGLVPVVVSESTAPVDLLLKKPFKIQGWVTTPDGNPVAGARIRAFSPQMPVVREATTSPNGRFTVTVSPLVPAVSVSIVPPGLPAKIISVPVAGSERIDIIVPWQGGNLLVRNRDGRHPLILRNGAVIFLTQLLQPVLGGTAPNITDDGIQVYVEPGEYMLCSKPVVSDQCARRWIAPGATAVVDWPPTHEHRKEPASP